VGRYFTSTAVHLATLALKDEQIAFLRKQLDEAHEECRRAGEARDAAVSKAFEILTPKPAPERGARAPREPRTPPQTLDLAEVDPTDTAAIRDIALSEMPAGRINPNFLIHKIENIRNQVYLARAAKSERAKEVGVIQEVPAAITEMIESAITTGREQARTQ
jgi:hypothetical protein